MLDLADDSVRLNLARWLLSERLREGCAARPAVLTESAVYTYEDLEARAQRVAGALRARGVGRGDRVLLALHDGVDFVATLFATLGLGAVVAMANPDVPAHDLERLLAYTEARALVAEPGAAAQVGARFAAGGGVLLVAGAGPHGLRAAAGHAVAVAPIDTAAGEPAVWLFTSGSTGAPRAVIHRHRDFAFHIERFGKGHLGLRPDDVTLAVPRLYFPYATGMNLLFPLAVGARTVLCADRPTPDRLLALLPRFDVTVFTTVPTMTAKLLAAAGANPPHLPHLRLAVTAGEALPERLHRQWDAAFHVPLLDGLGSAEMFHMYVANRPHDIRHGTLGWEVDGYEVRIVNDEDGRVVDAAPGEIGTLWVRGASAGIGYYADPERTRAVFRSDGWVVTGDTFARTADGTLRFAGRSDDLLKVGGIYVSPLEVEAVLREHPAVEDCAVVGQADDDGLIKPCAYLVLRAGVLALGDADSSGAAEQTLLADLQAHARTQLARYKVPRRWVRVAALPRNDRGKVVRRTLREAVGRVSANAIPAASESTLSNDR